MGWFNITAAQWRTDQTFESNVTKLNISNDTRKRMVKDISDFTSFIQNLERRDDVIKGRE